MPVPENLPEGGKKIFESTMEALKGKTNPRTKKPYTDEERAKIAWSAVKRKYTRKAEGWELKSLPSYDFEECFNSEPLEFKSENGNYYFSGYLSTFDKDLTDDIVTTSCMDDMLSQIKMGMNGTIRSFKGSPDHDVYWMDDQYLKPFSKITDAKVDAKGLFISGMFNKDHPDFKWDEIQNGFYDGLSIEYKAKDFTFKYGIDGSKTRVLNRVQLKGYGHTPRPANPFATLTDVFVKSLILEELNDEAKGNLTEDRVEMFMKDEKQASDEYEKLGFMELANDEKRHYDFFKRMKEGENMDCDEDEELIKARITAHEGEREKRKMSEGEYYAFPRLKKLPIFDASHVRNAMARFNQTQGMTSEEKATAKRKIIRAAHKFGIEVGEFGDSDEKKGVDLMTETEEIKAQPVPEKTEVKEEKKEEKVEKKSVDDLEEKIRSIVKDELKSLVPEKKSLPNTEGEQQGKFEEIKSKEPSDLTGYVVRNLGG